MYTTKSYKLSDLFNIDEIQELSESFTRLTGTVTAILDIDGNILTASGWQSLCTEFHRVNPITAIKCRESDTVLASKLKSGEQYNVYKCKNGLVDVAVPIVIDEMHLGNLFTGQFFFEPPDREFFVKQAEEFNFNKEEYLEALSRVPIFTEEYIEILMDYLLRLARLICEMGLSKKKDLDNSERLFSSYMDGINAYVYIKDSDSNYTFINKKTEELFNITRAGLKKRQYTDFDFFDKQMAEQLRENDRLIMNTDRKLEFEERGYPKGVQTTECRHYLALKFPLKDESDKIVGLCGFSYDITESKKMEEEIRLQREIIMNIDEGVVLIKADDGTIIYTNPKFNSIFNYEEGELIGRDISIVNAPTDVSPKEVAKQIQSVLKATGRWEGEVLSIRKDGIRFWCSAVVAAFTYSTYGTVWVSISQDITKRKETERQTLEAGERLRAIIDNSPAVIFLMDTEGKHQLVNSRFEKLFNTTKAEIIGKTVYDLFPAEVADGLRQNDREVLLTLKPKQFIETVPEDNVVHTYLSIKFPLFDANAQVYGVCGIATDITELKRNEDIIRTELALKSSTARVTEALLNPELDRYDISEVVYKEALTLTESKHGYASVIDKETGENVAVNLTDMMGVDCNVTRDVPVRFPKGPDGYNAMWGHSLNTKEGFYTNNPSCHPAFKNCSPSGHIPIERFLSVPVIFRGELVGQIALANPNRDYNDGDLETITRLASIYALALERRNMEEIIRLERDKLISIMDAMDAGIYIVSKTYDIEYINPIIKKDFGPINGKKCYEYFHERTDSCPWCKNEEVFSGKSVYWNWYSSKNNKSYKLFDTPIKNIDGSISKFEIFYDVTDMINLQVALTKELEFKSAFVEVSEALLTSDRKDIADIAKIVHRQALILTKSPVGYVSEIDRKTGNEVGHTLSSMIEYGQCDVEPRLKRLTFPKGPDGYTALWGHTLNTRNAFYTNSPETHQSFKGCIPTGHIPLRRYMAAPVLIGGELIGQIAVANSVSDYTDEDLNLLKRLTSIYGLAVQRKRMEDEISTININLQKRVEEEVAKNRIKDQLMYEQSRHISMGELLMNISHHWRQPLCAIGLFIQDIKDAYRHNELNEEYLHDNIGHAMSQLKVLSDTIDTFRNFYTREKEQVEFNIADEINKAEMLLYGDIKDRDIVVNKEFDKSLTTRGYPNEFAHVILNILTNAYDIFEMKKIISGVIKIKLYKDDSTGKIITTITNNGGEIPKDIRSKIFDPYFTTKDKSRVSGMGLYMARLIIEEHMNGTISVRNIDGWCEFRIEI
ncbi:MAG: PocR ligand-binding domain-containing protein [Nitrospirae bacterium]|nr:PocR ligand-binding domain-containing protein [Nitrospirota bacterium]MBF0553290.1 PocR ligand-binding domain-containing protein [Nitrospirota bacterium]